MVILPIPAEERDRDDRTRLMVPFNSSLFIIVFKCEMRKKLDRAISDVKAPACPGKDFEFRGLLFTL
jgi:hypothetical protein